MTADQKSKCERIYNYYGAEKQRRQLVEECAELIQAITKLGRAADTQDSAKIYEATLCLREEIADVEIMLEQIKNAPSVRGKGGKYQDIITYKLNRQLERIAKEKAEWEN